jgi:hypothetical protein
VALRNADEVWCDSKPVPCFAPHGFHAPLLGTHDLRPDREASLVIRLSATMVERNGNFRDLAALCVRA